MTNCTHCNKPSGGETVELKKKWVSSGPVRPYGKPVVVPCHKACKSAYLDDRARYYAVLDETMNTHRDFVRVSGQDGYVKTQGGDIPCKGWQSASEVGVEYHAHKRYLDYV